MKVTTIITQHEALVFPPEKKLTDAQVKAIEEYLKKKYAI
jgi:hypothetical protein